MPAKLSLQASLQLSEGMRLAFRRLVGVATADLFLGARAERSGAAMSSPAAQ